MHEEIVRLCRLVPMIRTYVILLGSDLFGRPFLEQDFGPCYGGKRTVRTRRFETREEAIAAAERMAASRRKAGYVDAT